MNVDKNARLTPRGRAEIVRRVIDQGQTPKAAVTATGVCERTVRKWVARFRAEGSQGLQDRSSRPHKLYRPTSAPVVRQIAALRWRRWSGASHPRTGPDTEALEVTVATGFSSIPTSTGYGHASRITLTRA